MRVHFGYGLDAPQHGVPVAIPKQLAGLLLRPPRLSKSANDAAQFGMRHGLLDIEFRSHDLCARGQSGAGSHFAWQVFGKQDLCVVHLPLY